MELEITVLNFPEMNKNNYNVNPQLTALLSFASLTQRFDTLRTSKHPHFEISKDLSSHNHQSSKTAGFPLEDVQVVFAVISLQYIFWYIAAYWKDQTVDTTVSIAITCSFCTLKIKHPRKRKDGLCWYHSRGKIWVSSQCCGWYLPPTPVSHMDMQQPTSPSRADKVHLI